MEIKDFISSGVLELYALGLASEEEQSSVLSQLNQPEVREELLLIEQSLESYAFAYAIEPGSNTKQRISKKIFNNASADSSFTGKRETPVVAISSFWKYAAAASILLFVGSAIMNFNYYNKIQSASKDKSQLENQLLAQQRVNEEMKADLSVVQSKYSEPVALKGLAASPEAAAKIFWMKNTGDVYIDASNLPQAPEGKQYQLWGIVDGKPVDGGLILTTEKNNQYRIQKMKVFSNVKVDAFAVTLEPTGGNPTPQGEMYVMGKM